MQSKSEALELRKLSSEELDAVSGGLLFALLQMPDVHQYMNGASSQVEGVSKVVVVRTIRPKWFNRLCSS